MPVLSVEQLPTPLALVCKRVNQHGLDSSANCYNLLTYISESLLKLIGIALYAGLQQNSPDAAYQVGHQFVNADSLGKWADAIGQCCRQPMAGSLAPEFANLLHWCSKKRTQEQEGSYRQAKEHCETILGLVDSEFDEHIKNPTVLHLIGDLVQIRNKTRAHGAVADNFYAVANSLYAEVISLLITTCPLLECKWIFVRPSGAASRLRGLSPDAENASDQTNHLQPGIHFGLGGIRYFFVGDLLRSDPELTSFYLPNGASNGKTAEFIDYGTGKIRRDDVVAFELPPAPLPKSKTHGLDDLVGLQSDVLGNLPPVPKNYVARPSLQKELEEKLLDQNHHIITLHGIGGVGKTSMALYVAHSLAEREDPPFEFIIWFSARDIDLEPSGPRVVRRAVADLPSICKQYASMFGGEPTAESFAKVLQSPVKFTKKGILFIFDNFETIDKLDELYKFLDTHARVPNKVLITTREREFKADYPIAVEGMERAEAYSLMRQAADDLHCEAVLTDGHLEEIFDFTDGKPYLMRLLIGEMSKEGRYLHPSKVVTRRADALSALFERSFSRLSRAGQLVFLIISNWRSAVSELALLAVLGNHDLDVERGIDECMKLALIESEESSDSQTYFSTPQSARIFGQKKLEGDPDRLLVKEELETIRQFGVVEPVSVKRSKMEDQIGRLFSWAKESAAKRPVDLAKLDQLLERVAYLFPSAWLQLARFRISSNSSQGSITEAFRMAVEELPFNIEAHVERARFAESIGDERTKIASYMSAIECDPSDVVLLNRTAGAVISYIKTEQVPLSRRRTYCANLRARMIAAKDRLNADALSRLGWLFLNETSSENVAKAEEYALLGLSKEPGNRFCLKVLDECAHFKANAASER